METVFLKSDVEPASDLAWIESAVECFLAKLNPAVLVSTTQPTAGTVDVINITEQNRHVGASGYHVWLNGQAVAYCSPHASGRLAGYYSPATYSKAITSFGKIIRPAKLRNPERFTPGLITTVCHEIAEAIADRDVETYTMPDKDGVKWLLEPCDWVDGSYWTSQINGTPAVFPNVALPSFSDLAGQTPFDLCGIVKAPFTKKATPDAYGWGLVGGVLKKIF